MYVSVASITDTLQAQRNKDPKQQLRRQSKKKLSKQVQDVYFFLPLLWFFFVHLFFWNDFKKKRAQWKVDAFASTIFCCVLEIEPVCFYQQRMFALFHPVSINVAAITTWTLLLVLLCHILFSVCVWNIPQNETIIEITPVLFLALFTASPFASCFHFLFDRLLILCF